MITDLNKILNEWAYRTKSGKPSPNNVAHQILLESVLKDYGWGLEERGELLNSLMEVDIIRKKQKDGSYGGSYVVKKHNPERGQKLVKKNASQDDVDKIKKDKKEKSVKPKRSHKPIRDVDTLEQEAFQEELGLSDEEFEERNKENEVEDKFVLSEESERALSKVPKKYRKLLERVLNTVAVKKNEQGKYETFGDSATGKLDYFGVGGGQGAGTTKSAMGELMTQMFSTLRTEGLFGEKDENGMYSGGLYRDIMEHLQKLESQGIKTHIDMSWVKAAMENRSAIMSYFREEFGNGYEIVATAWDVPREVEALGLPYDDKQSTTDTFFKVRDADGNEMVLECSLKKSFTAMLYNGGLGTVIKGAETELNIEDFVDDQMNSLNNVFDKKQKTLVAIVDNLDLTSDETKEIIEEVSQEMGGTKAENRDLVRTQLNHTIQAIQEDLLSNPGLKIDRDYIQNVTQAGVKKGKFTKDKKSNNKIMLMLLQVAGKLDDGMKSDFDRHKKITQDFEENVIKELNENSSFKDSVLNQCRENLPLQDILEGKEFMAAGKTPVTRKMLIDMFGTDDWSKVKENLEVDTGPPLMLVYNGSTEGSKPIKFANIVVREDGKGYGAGRMKFELKFNNNFRDNAINSSQDIYEEYRPEGGQIPIRFKKKR